MARQEQTEGLRLIADWCKWLVTIETGAIAWLAESVSTSPHSQFRIGNLAEQICILSALLSFIVSIISAGLICSAIPTSVTDILPDEKVMNRGIFLAGCWLGPLWLYMQTLFFTFLIGIVALSTGIGCILFWR
jgi:hypothetical protein